MWRSWALLQDQQKNPSFGLYFVREYFVLTVLPISLRIIRLMVILGKNTKPVWDCNPSFEQSTGLVKDTVISLLSSLIAYSLRWYMHFFYTLSRGLKLLNKRSQFLLTMPSCLAMTMASTAYSLLTLFFKNNIVANKPLPFGACYLKQSLQTVDFLAFYLLSQEYWLMHLWSKWDTFQKRKNVYCMLLCMSYY